MADGGGFRGKNRVRCQILWHTASLTDGFMRVTILLARFSGWLCAGSAKEGDGGLVLP